MTVPNTGGDRLTKSHHLRRPALRQPELDAEADARRDHGQGDLRLRRYTMAYTTVIKQLGPFLASNKLKPTGMAGSSVMGFSAGGTQRSTHTCRLTSSLG